MLMRNASMCASKYIMMESSPKLRFDGSYIQPFRLPIISGEQIVKVKRLENFYVRIDCKNALKLS